MKLSSKLAIAVFVGIVGVLFVAGVSLAQFNRIHKTVLAFTKKLYPSQLALDTISMGVMRLKVIVLQMRGEEKNPTKRRALQDEFDVLETKVLSGINDYQKNLVTDETDARHITAAANAVNQALKDLRDAISHGEPNDHMPRAESWLRAEQSTLIVQRALEEGRKYIIYLEAKEREAADSAYESALVLTVVADTCWIIVLAGTAYWVYQSMVVPMLMIRQKVDEISGTLDLQQRIDLGRTDELRYATDAINRLLDRAHGGMINIKAQHDAAAYSARHDALTGLPNRLFAMEFLTSAVARSKNSDKKVALMFIDLDGFKCINDAHGHDVGDIVLKEVASRLKATLRANDFAARLGGDEFLIVVGGLAEVSVAGFVAEKIISELSNPILYETYKLTIGASIGIAVAPDHGDNAMGLLHAADSAMYAIKQSSKNAYRFVSTQISH